MSEEHFLGDKKKEEKEEEEVSSLFLAVQNGSQELVQLLLNEEGANVDSPNQEEGATPLFLAALNGHLEVVQLLLDRGANVHALKNEGGTPLHAAAWNGHQEVIQVLLEREANIDAPNENGATPLALVAQKGYLGALQVLLNKGANIHAPKKDGVFPLHVAAWNGHQEVAQIFLDKGANVNALTESGTTPLFMAAQAGHQEVIQVLLKKGANVNVSNQKGETPIFTAAQKGHKEVIQVLLKKGANVNPSSTMEGGTPLYVAAQNGFLEIVQILLNEAGTNIDAPKKDGTTPLFIASQYGHLEIVQVLLDKGANVNAPKKDGGTPFFIASQFGHLEIVQVLWNKGVTAVDAPLENEATPLYVAAQNGHLKVVQFLLEHGANVNARKKPEGVTPLFRAAWNGHLEVVQLLLDRGANVDPRRKPDGITPLYVAAQNGHLEVVQLLLDRGAAIDTLMADGATALYIAAQKGHLEIVQFLSNRGANVNVVKKEGGTPLLMAAWNGHLEVVQFLLDRGANVNAPTLKGGTPLYGAAQNGHFGVVQLLLHKGANPNALTKGKATPLYIAAQFGHLKIVQALWRKEAAVDTPMEDGSTPLYIAAQNGYLEVVQFLVDRGANVSVQKKLGGTPLFMAVWNGHLEVVQFLADRGANINAARVDGVTPLYVAAQNKHLEVVQFLLDKGANLNALNKVGGTTTLYVAAQLGHLEIVQLLLSKGATIDAPAKKDGATPLFAAGRRGHLEVVQCLLSKGANPNFLSSPSGEIFLHGAAWEGHAKIVEIALNQGAKIDAPKKNGATPLHLAATNGKLEVVQCLLNKGANVDAATETKATALYSAAEKGHLEIVRNLLDKGANVHGLRENGETPLFIAAQEGHSEVVQVLLDKGATMNLQRKAPLTIAAQKGHLGVAQVLLNAGANVNTQNHEGTTPVFIASQNGHLEVVRLLLNKGANINDLRIQNGGTALHIVAQKGYPEVFQLLLSKGANVHILTKAGHTTFFFAVSYGNVRIGQILIENGVTPFLDQKLVTQNWKQRMREFAKWYLPRESLPSVISDPLHQLVLESIATGLLDLGDPLLRVTDEMFEKFRWPQIGPFLSHIIVRQKGITSLPIGLAYLSVERIKQIQFMTDENWRKLDKVKAGESASNIIEYCKAKLEGGVVKMKALRLMVMGGPAVGKTTMIRRLRSSSESGWWWPEIGDQKNMKLLSTDGVELGDVVLNDGTILETWDFGGQKIYRVSHQLFLRDFCVYAVMCRVNDVPEAALKELRFWIESVLSRTQKVQILLITTHGDRLSPNEAEVAQNHLHQSLIHRYGEEKIYPQAVMLKRVANSKMSLFVPKEDKEVGELRSVLLKISDQVAFDAPASLEMIRVALEHLGGGGGGGGAPIVKISVVHRVIEQVGEQKGIKALKDEERRMKYLEDLDTLGYIYLVRPRKIVSFSCLNHSCCDSATPPPPPPPEMAVVLSPHWISRLLATLITTKHNFAQSSGGVIDRDTLTLHLWQNEEDFPKKYHEDMIDLLVQLHIMFPLLRLPSKQQQQQKYLVPCLLKEYEPQHNCGVQNGFGFPMMMQEGRRNCVVLNRILKMKNQALLPIAVLPMVIVQLMNIGEVIECWQQGCAVAISSSSSSSPNSKNRIFLSKKTEVVVECCCLVKKNQGDELMIHLEGISSEVAGWWMNEVMRSLENMLEEFYHMDYQVDVVYHGWGGGEGGREGSLSCFPTGCCFSFSYLYERLAQRKVTAFCQNKSHKVALQYLVPDLLIQEASSLSLVSWENLEIEKELGQGAFGKVLLCSSLINFPNLRRNKKTEIKRKEKREEKREKKEDDDEGVGTKFMYAVKLLEIRQNMMQEQNGGAGVVGKEMSNEAGLQKDFLLEVYTMTGLVHPNVVRLVGLTQPISADSHQHSLMKKNGVHENHAMVMELVGGGELYEQLNFMGLKISVHVNKMIQSIGDYCGKLNLHFANPKVFHAPEPLPPLSQMCDCAFQKIDQNFEKWLSIAERTHGEQINDLKNSFENDIKRSYERSFEGPKEEKLLFQNLEEISNKIRDAIYETTEICAPLPWILRLKIAFEIARGVQYLHSFNPPIIHRDLKTPNVFLSSPLVLFPINENTLRAPLAKVGDFGLSVKLLGVSSLVGGENTKTEHTNPTWAAPELLKGEEFTEKIDIYAIGIILWEILVRRHPFSLGEVGSGLMEVLAGFIVKKGRPSIPASLLQRETENNPEILSKYLSLMNWCWDHEPSNRPTAFQVCESLRDMMEGEASLFGKIVDEDGFLDHLRKEDGVVVTSAMVGDDASHSRLRSYSSSRRSQSLAVSTMRVTNMVPPSLLLKNENWKVKSVLFAGLDLVWIGFWNGYVGVIEVKKAIAGGNDSAELILCHKEEKHNEEVGAMVYQSVGGYVWASSTCGTLQVWRDTPLTREDAIGHFNIKGWLRDESNFVYRPDVWVSLDTGRLRIFKHQYFGAEEDSIPITKNMIVECLSSTTGRPVIHVHCPEEKKTFKFAKAKSEEDIVRGSPSLFQWQSTLEQFARTMSFDFSLLRLGVKLPENGQKKEKGGVRIFGLEAVGYSVWGFTSTFQGASESFEVIEFTLIAVEDEHGLYRTWRVETKRRLKLDQSEIDIRFQNIGGSGLVAMGMRNLCLSIGNAVGMIHIPLSTSEKMSVEWIRKEHRGGSFIRCLASVWNGNYRVTSKPEEEEATILHHQLSSPSPSPSPSPSLSHASVKQGPELWVYDGEKILVFRSSSSSGGGSVHNKSHTTLILVDKIEVPSDFFLSCLTQVGPNEIWGGNAVGSVVGWEIDSRSLFPDPLLSGEHAHDGVVSSLAAPSRVVGVGQKTSAVFSGSVDGTLRLFCFKKKVNMV